MPDNVHSEHIFVDASITFQRGGIAVVLDGTTLGKSIPACCPTQAEMYAIEIALDYLLYPIQSGSCNEFIKYRMLVITKHLLAT